MKLPSFLPLLAILSVATSSIAEVTKVQVTVRSLNADDKKPDAKKDKKEEGKAEVDSRILEATVKNYSKEPISAAEILFFYVGRTSGSPDVKVLQKDSQSKEILGGATIVVSSKPLVATFKGAHTTKPKKESKEKAERIKAVGDKFTGWGVQVMVGGVVAGEAYSSPTIKDSLVEKDAPVPPTPAT